MNRSVTSDYKAIRGRSPSELRSQNDLGKAGGGGGGLNRAYKCLIFVSDSNIVPNQLLQLCTARTVFSMSVSVRLYTVMPKGCRLLINEK